ncbi:hypothetical protein ACQKFK_29875 [Bacillus mycoides]|uniref:SunI/YnzG family protein n=1 Tax=Bacillus mycoides TaxID=1405 RepID=UPI003D088D6B
MIFIDWHCAHVKIPRDKILEIKKKNIIPTKHDKLVKIGVPPAFRKKTTLRIFSTKKPLY